MVYIIYIWLFLNLNMRFIHIYLCIYLFIVLSDVVLYSLKPELSYFPDFEALVFLFCKCKSSVNQGR